MNIELENHTRGKILKTVLLYLGKCFSTDSETFDKYAPNAIISDTQLITEDKKTFYNTYRDKILSNGFYGRSESWIKQWFANKIKMLIKDEFGPYVDVWDRSNLTISTIFGYPISVCYECYDFLCGKSGYTYGGISQMELDKLEVFLYNTITDFFDKFKLHYTPKLYQWIDKTVEYFLEYKNELLSTDTYLLVKNGLTIHNLWPNTSECKAMFQRIENKELILQITTETFVNEDEYDQCLWFKALYFHPEGLSKAIYNTILDFFKE